MRSLNGNRGFTRQRARAGARTYVQRAVSVNQTILVQAGQDGCHGFCTSAVCQYGWTPVLSWQAGETEASVAKTAAHTFTNPTTKCAACANTSPAAASVLSTTWRITMTSSDYITDGRLGYSSIAQSTDGLEGITTGAVIERALELFDDDERTANLCWSVHTSQVTIWDITVDVNEEFDIVEFALECVDTAVQELCEA
jgi:hypothetical protein